ncbi:hypothetical protein BST91_08010 [Nonlabens tegetincola]|uniref:polysaccharide pyruvyl transferase family protein n=1 Tax=Nonlabens tegetincola TaxID=323273 RepID=UPI000A208CCB|nr:polysaccharide pyruvyl transferase family protein [Nonlabens tegetincola]ARN71589.1 hypothetical protein BST91_08010 [Nonlabens tegetincola]
MNQRLYWWSECFIQKKPYENYGDLIGAYLFGKITGEKPLFYRKKDKPWWRRHKSYYATCGSIISHLDEKAIVWGSGIIHQDSKVPKATFLAVRGPLSRKRILESHIDCPTIYGDPALLLSHYYKSKKVKTAAVGIIPHINDYQKIKEWYKNIEEIKVINLNTNDVESTTNEIVSCERIISSSLHGLIVPHSYGIPSMHVEFSKNIHGDGIKYLDYFESVQLESMVTPFIDTKQKLDRLIHQTVGFHLPNKELITKLCMGLMDTCPFKPLKNG